MNNPQFSAVTRAFHVVDKDHGMRAQIAMHIVQCGGHAEIYENLQELLDARPTSGVVLVNEPAEGVSSFISSLYDGRVYLPVIIFAENPKASQIIQAAHGGAADFLQWPFPAEDLAASYDYSLRFLEQTSGALIRQRQAQEMVNELTCREKQILVFLLHGHSNKSMGQALKLSPRTVEDYRLKALRKLGVSSTSAAIRIGLEAGLGAVTPEACCIGEIQLKVIGA